MLRSVILTGKDVFFLANYLKRNGGVHLEGTLAYSLASFGHAFSVMTVSFYLMYYYTDILRLQALSVTAILFLSRFFDGAVDPFIGHYMDARTTKYGKYRGYLYYWAAPSSLLFVLLFVPPPARGIWAIAWCLIVYLCWSFASSMIEVAHLPLMASISSRENRNLTNTRKITASILAVVVSAYLALKLVKVFGGDSDQKGFFITASIFACVSFASILLGARDIEERETYAENPLPFLDSVSAVLKKKSMIFMYLAILCEQMCEVARNQGAIYYLKYYLRRADAIPLMLLTGVSGALFAQPLILKASRRLSTSRLMMVGLLAATVSSSLVWFTGRSIALLMSANFLFGVSIALPANLIYVYAAELADDMSCGSDGCFCGIVNSLLGIASKLGYTAAGAFVAFSLYLTSYVPDAVQRDAALFGIRICFIALPSVMALLGAVFASISFLHAKREKSRALDNQSSDEDKLVITQLCQDADR
jgi:GPH family glycoside/pentoside/hexuronide:cation symporter